VFQVGTQVTGASSDGQTLFFWDSAARRSYAVFVDSEASEYRQVVELGALGPVQPNAACLRLYTGPAPGTVEQAPFQ
jgi:hypothetical protein